MGLEKDIRDVNVAYYYPSTVAPSKEFKALAAIENPELKLLWEKAWKWFCNTFVYDTDIDGLKRWESMLSIAPKPGSSIEDRRQEILLRINISPPYTERSLQNMLDGNFGNGSVNFNVLYDRYRVELHIANSSLHVSSKAYRFTRIIIPANMELLLLFAWYLSISTKHKARIEQYMNAVHNFWRQGAISKVMWNGKYGFNREARWGGIAPDTDYRDRQTHKLSTYLTVTWNQYQSRKHGTVNYDGCICFNGQHNYNYDYSRSSYMHNTCNFCKTINGKEVQGGIEIV